MNFKKGFKMYSTFSGGSWIERAGESAKSACLIARSMHRLHQRHGRYISKDDILNVKIFANTELDKPVTKEEINGASY